MPFLQPTFHPCAEIARTLGEKPLRQIRRAALQILLTYFDNGQKLIAFSAPATVALVRRNSYPYYYLLFVSFVPLNCTCSVFCIL